MQLMRCFLQFILPLILSSACLAMDITTRAGITYKKAEVTAVEWDGLRITHSTGVAKIPVEELPEALQKQYRYDLSAVAAYRKKSEENASAVAAAQQRERERIANILQQEKRAKADSLKRAEEVRIKQEEERIKQERIQQTVALIGRVVMLVLVIGIGLFLYFIPSIVGRTKTNAGAIFVLNLLLGWSFIGWVIALVWACTKDSAMDTLARQRMNEADAGGPRALR